MKSREKLQRKTVEPPVGVCLNPLVLRVSSRERAEISGAAYAGNCSCLRAVFSAFMHFKKVNH